MRESIAMKNVIFLISKSKKREKTNKTANKKMTDGRPEEFRLYHFPLIIDSVPITYCVLMMVQVIVIAALADEGYDFAKGDKTYKQQFDLYMVFFPMHLAFQIMIVKIFLLYQRNSIETARLTTSFILPPDPTDLNYIPLTIKGLLEETILNARPAIYCSPLYMELWCITSNLNLPPEHRYSWFFAFIPLFSLLLWLLFESVQRQNWYGNDVRELISSFAMRMNIAHQHRVEYERKVKMEEGKLGKNNDNNNNNNNNNNDDMNKDDDDITLAVQ